MTSSLGAFLRLVILGGTTVDVATVFVVLALDVDAGEHLVGVYATLREAENVAAGVPGPWAVMIQRATMGERCSLPEIAR